jgi:phosphoribosylanthranilate isomerase
VEAPLNRTRGRGSVAGVPPGVLAVSRVRVSVCAVRSEADVEAVVAGGADAVGVLVLTRHRAEDSVTLDHACRLLALVPPYVGRYAVTHAVHDADLARIMGELPVDTLQLHDDVDVEVVSRLRARHPGIRLVKALHVRGGRVDDPSPWVTLVDAFVADSVDPTQDRIGGTGLVHDWEVSAALARHSPLPLVLAGGLDPTNVTSAIETVRPWAVNVNSGVERDGSKDEALVRAFVSLGGPSGSALSQPVGGRDHRPEQQPGFGGALSRRGRCPASPWSSGSRPTGRSTAGRRCRPGGATGSRSTGPRPSRPSCPRRR